jgi:hypothetical protein
MKFFFLISITSLVLASANENTAIALIMSKLQARTGLITEYMAKKINQHSPQLQKRKILGNLMQNLKDYIHKTYTQKSLESFQPVMKQEVDNSLAQHQRFTKRDIIMTADQEKYRRYAFSDWISKRLDVKFKNHMMSEFQMWKKKHTFKKMREAGLLTKDKSSIRKRKLEESPRNVAIYSIVTSFLLIPVFMNPFTIGFYGFLFSIVLYSVFFDPILKRITFGKW